MYKGPEQLETIEDADGDTIVETGAACNREGCCNFDVVRLRIESRGRYSSAVLTLKKSKKLRKALKRAERAVERRMYEQRES